MLRNYYKDLMENPTALWMNCPIISIDMKVWKFWSYLLTKNHKVFFSVVPLIFLNIFQFMFLYTNWGDVQQMIQNGYFTVLYFQVNMRLLLLVFNRPRYEKFLQEIDRVYKEILVKLEKKLFKTSKFFFRNFLSLKFH